MEKCDFDSFNSLSILRCYECDLIPSFLLSNIKNKCSIIYNCPKKHNRREILKDYIEKNRINSIFNKNCCECNKKPNLNKNDFHYCSTCKKILCNNCIQKHDEHNEIKLNRLDGYCLKHLNTFYSYCKNCKTNLCAFCLNEHQNHTNLNLSSILLTENNIKEYYSLINNFELKIQKLDEFGNKLLLSLKKYKEDTLEQINFFKNLLYTYEYEVNKKNLNYNTIENLSEIKNQFKIITHNYEKIEESENNLISLIDNSSFIFSNKFEICKKTIQEHSGTIICLKILKDGRIASSSNDTNLNIYSKKKFELQMKINIHNGPIYYFTQLQNGKIITTSSDKTMKIISLLDDNNYKLEQILEGHIDRINKVIEKNGNIIISFSRDKTMRIWNLSKKNIYKCDKIIEFLNTNSSSDALILNKKEFITTSYEDHHIKFWDLENYTNINTFTNIETSYPAALCLLTDKILCIGGVNSKGFYLINIETHILIKNIIAFKGIYSVVKCIDNLFAFGVSDLNNKNSIVKYKYENGDFKLMFIKECAHNSSIWSIVELNDGTIVTGSADKTIKVWV